MLNCNTNFFLLCFKVGKHEVSQGIKAKRSLYENNLQDGMNNGQKKENVSKVRKENVVVEKNEAKEEKSESKAKNRKERKDSESRQGNQLLNFISKVH